ncbi:benzoate/H(+) symporter BenE family transporter [Streptomyces sp. WMMC897]|uniref:benzoate/H(+) symporter BenE family transporter n=1 Tax=Streptomyces sp. WMMC897 TaxID=3014782 RepID=UPI0022B6809D|nr:benzoate/H(+) symporter BenE family transporter [Streptomyces sp. WMMC897]MCZ7414538.1 benzoate/H(+) symporter BenE family transporter [Streptomyces sp. WMMC897]
MSPEREPRGGGALSVSTGVAGLIVVLVSYAGPMAVVFQAAEAGGLSASRVESWVWALSIGSGLTCVVLSLAYRVPVITAWSTPGAALLVPALTSYTFAEAVGAYLIAAALTVLVGVTGLFGTLMRLLPQPLASAMLAGILVGFGMDLFRAAESAWWLVAVMFAVYVLARRWVARWATALALLAGVVATVLSGDTRFAGVRLELATPVLTAPQFSVSAAVGLAIPLFLVTMASQNAPGVATLRAAGYRADADRLVGSTGLASALLAPVGAHAINLAAITAAICTGPDAHRDPAKRYGAGVASGVFYLLVGIFGTTLVAVFRALPEALVAATAGIALLGALGGALAGATSAEEYRDSALPAFLVTASGVELLGVGSAFWGLLVGVGVYLVLRARRRPAESMKQLAP